MTINCAGARARRSKAGVAAVAALLLGGCMATTQPQRPCCYQGPVSLVHAEDLVLGTGGGQSLRFAEVFPGFEPQSGLLGRPLPFREADIRLVTYGALRRVMPEYDANGNGVLEQPELTVLFIREAALGLGHPVVEVNGPMPQALVLSQADVGGLTRWVSARQASMAPEAQAVFRELEMLGRDLRTNPDGSDRDRQRLRPLS